MFGTILNATFGTILRALPSLVHISIYCNAWHNPQSIAMLPRVVVQVLSQLQEASHHDAVQNGDDDHLDNGDGAGSNVDHT